MTGWRRIITTLEPVAARLAFWGGAALVLLPLVLDASDVLGWRAAFRSRTRARGPSAAPTDPGWPHLRGPGYDGVSDETDLADSWPPEGPPLCWMREIGEGYSALIAAGDRVYTQTQDVYAQWVVCLDAATGETMWRHRCGPVYQPSGPYPGPRATPTWHAGLLFFATPDGRVGCLDAVDGGLYWSVDLYERFGGEAPGFGYACSPLVEDGRVILPVGQPGASLVALDARDGSTVWASGDQPASYSSPIAVSFRGRRVVAALMQNGLALLDLSNGRVLWEEVWAHRSAYDEHATTPLYDEPHLMITCPFRRGSVLYRLEAKGQPARDGPGEVEVQRVRLSKVMSNDVASSVLVDGRVYGFDLRDIQTRPGRASRGKFTCMDFATGMVQWTSDRTGHASVIAADGKLLLLSDTGDALMLRAHDTGYQELGRVRVFENELCWTTPTLHQGHLFVRSPTRAACLWVGRGAAGADGSYTMASAREATGGTEDRSLLQRIAARRETPLATPQPRELAAWFVGNVVGVLIPATLVAAVVGGLVVGRKRKRPAWAGAGSLFWGTVLVAGVAGTPVYSEALDCFLFTWPAALFALHQLVLGTLIWARRHHGTVGGRWAGTLAALAFLAGCVGYFYLCKELRMMDGLAFLLGLLPSWPLAVPSARRVFRSAGVAGSLILAWLAFALYFWGGGAVILWRWFSSLG